MFKLSRIIPVFALAFAAIGSAHADGVRILGRSMPNPGGGFTIQWPSSGFEAAFTGTQLTATIDDWGSNWFNVEVDGVTTRLDLRPGVNTYVLFSGAAGQHKVRVTRRTGSQVGATRILDVRARKGDINPTETPDRKILVIGDSIASGYGVECTERAERYSPATQNADLAFPALLAKSFNADLQTISVDGRGLIRNYAGDDPPMQTVAWRVLPDSNAAWPATTWQPQVVIINLGISDFAAGDPGEPFVTAYTGLIHRIRIAYPGAEIIGGFGAMLDTANYTAAKAATSKAVDMAKDAKASFVELKPANAPKRYGCDWHPGVDAQQEIATQFQSVIEKRLGWAGRQNPPQTTPALVWLSGASTGR